MIDDNKIKNQDEEIIGNLPQDSEEDLNESEDSNVTEGFEDLIISTDINSYGLSEEEKEELGIESQQQDEEEYDEEGNQVEKLDEDNVPQDEYDQYGALISSSCLLTGNDNNYQENNDKISFAADITYQDEYLRDVYDTEDFYFLKFMKDKFQEELKKFIQKNKRFSFLKSFDISFLEEGDEIILKTEKEPYTIQYIFSFDEIFICKKDNSSIKFATLADIRPFDKVTSQLKDKDISEIYCSLNKVINDRNCNNVDFFNIFIEYFKMQEKKLFFILPEDIQKDIVRELKKSKD